MYLLPIQGTSPFSFTFRRTIANLKVSAMIFLHRPRPCSFILAMSSLLSLTTLQGQDVSHSASLPFLPQLCFSCKCSFDSNHYLPKHSSTSLINLLQISQKQCQTTLCTCSLLALPSLHSLCHWRCLSLDLSV